MAAVPTVILSPGANAYTVTSNSIFSLESDSVILVGPLQLGIVRFTALGSTFEVPLTAEVTQPLAALYAPKSLVIS